LYLFSYAVIDYYIESFNFEASSKDHTGSAFNDKVKEDKDLTSGPSKVQSINSLEVVTTRYFTFSMSLG
jgi:hypothetical protein